MKRRDFLKSGLIAGAALSTFGVPLLARATSKPATVPIALVIPLSGTLGSFGQNELRGWEIAVEEINANGGIQSLGGAKLEAVVRDHQGLPRIGMGEVEKVAADKRIPIMVGCWSSAVTFPAAQVAEQYKMPHIIDIGSQTDILRRGFKYVFRYIQSTDAKCADTVRFSVEMGKKHNLMPKTAAIIARDDSYGKEAAEAFASSFERHGIKIVEKIIYPSKVANLDVEAAKIKAAKPDLIYSVPFLADGVLLSKALAVAKVECMAYVALGGIGEPEFLNMVGPLAEGIFMQTNIDEDQSRDIDRRLNEKMMAKYGVHNNQFSAALYGIVYLIKDVLERAGTVGREAVREALAATNITSGNALAMPSKFIRFDENGENIGAMCLIAQCYQKKWHTVWPFELSKVRQGEWPMPKRS